MNLRHMQIFVTVAETKSMSETARSLYMTQPAVSQTILELEEELQVKLFDRLRRKLILTEPGDIFFTYSKRTLQLIEEARKTIQDFREMTTGRLSIGTSTTVGTYLLPGIISSFRNVHPEADVCFTINNTRIIEELILNHELNIGIVEGITSSAELVKETFVDDELILICSPDHHWVQNGKKSISLADIEKEPLIMREEGSGTRDVVEDGFAQQDVSIQPNHVLNNGEAIKRMVEENVGVSFLSRVAVQEELAEGKLVEIGVEGMRFQRTFNIIYHRDKYQSPLFHAFTKHLKDLQE